MSRFFGCLLLLCSLATPWLPAQDLPQGLAPHEAAAIPRYRDTYVRQASGPPAGPVRTMAEWEEVGYLVVTWTQYIPVLRDIVRHAQEEAPVLIVCADSVAVQAYLSARNIPLDRVSFLQAPFNSIWMRDYGANSVYAGAVDSLLLVDWIYNRPRPADDTLPRVLARHLGLDVYSMNVPPYDLVHTGGNFMSDGLGTAFSSELVLMENSPAAPFALTAKTEAQIDSLMNLFMGIDRYVKMPVLPYDGIHHIDMHMKLLDEETLLVGQYPAGVADGPQIEANLQYVLDHFPSPFGTPYEVVRIPMPPWQGQYPDVLGVPYRTYANAVFVNKLLLVPVYEPAYDTTALRILREALPGYRVQGINCNQIIPAGGALHCVTQAIGVRDPLLISHQRLRDTEETSQPYRVQARIEHRSGIAQAQIFFSTDTATGFQPVNMSLLDSVTGTWEGFIPAQPPGRTVAYYLAAEAQSGKAQVRPLPAPAGFWQFEVEGVPTALSPPIAAATLGPAFPNPASALTCVPVHYAQAGRVSLRLHDALGRLVLTLYEGVVTPGEARYYFQARPLPAGTYLLSLRTQEGRQVQRLMVQ